MEIEQTARPKSGNWSRSIVIVVAIGAAMFAIFGAVHSGDPTDRSSFVAAQVGADYCTLSSYELTNRHDGHKSPIYDCEINGSDHCVTESNGITTDSTAEVRQLFASTVGETKPGCVS